jgi:hypothetical protein
VYEGPEKSFRIKCRKNMSHILSDVCVFFICTVYGMLQAIWQSQREQIYGMLQAIWQSQREQICLIVCFLLGNSPASEFCMPTFRNTLFHLHRQVGMKKICLATYVVRLAVSEQASEQWIYFFNAVNVGKICRCKYVNRALIN